MRRLLASVLALFIFLITSGVVVTVHECHSKGKKEILAFQEKSCCGPKKKSCAPPTKSRMEAESCCELSDTWVAAHVETVVFHEKSDIQPKSTATPVFASFSPDLGNPKAVFPVNSISDPPDIDHPANEVEPALLRVFRI